MTDSLVDRLRDGDDLSSRMEGAVEIERLKMALEAERSQVAEAVTAMKSALMAREWLRLGRGSYEYDDDRWRDEFSAAWDEIYKALDPLRKIAGDWSDCPVDTETVRAVRAVVAGSVSERGEE